MGLFDVFRRRSIQIPQASRAPETQHVTDQMLNDLALAESIYTNKPHWLQEESPALEGAGIGPLVAAEVSRLITIEMKVTVEGDNNAELDNVVQKYLLPNMRDEVEKGWALGGLVMKPFYQDATFTLDDEGNVTGVDGRIKIDFKYPAEFIINNFDASGTIFDISFYSMVSQEQKFYTLVERQFYDEATETLTITNVAYRTGHQPTRFKWDNLGSDIVPLTDVKQWENILPKLVFTNMRGTLLGFYRPALANNTDLKSPYGLSGLVRAAHAIKRADRTYNNLDWEMDSSLARLFIDEVSLVDTTRVPKKVSKMLIRLLGGPQRYFEKFNPTIREANYLRVWNSHLRQVEDVIGLAHGTISEVEHVAKTASEIKVTKQRTYAMIVGNQEALKDAIEQLVYSIAIWKNPTAVIEGVSTTFNFDDSITQDAEAKLGSLMTLHSSGLIPGYMVIMDYYNCDKEEAKKIVAEAAGELFDDADPSDEPFGTE